MDTPSPYQDERAYAIEGMSCRHCVAAVREEVEQVDGVQELDVEIGRLVVRGQGIDDAAVRAAVDEAGYEVTS